ncbi:T9SS type A sorting domain-containing protein [Flavobacterium sp.]|uniref:T9SS type A sorting domain-containing protein n=1 Tax=Flavobacterium sp. TaxID=239 RepID=UPI002FD9D260
MKKLGFFTLLLLTLNTNAQIKILFDATKAETAGNADWVIDADTHNLGFSSGPAITGTGNEANPQRTPSPLQSNITSSTPETYWNGGLSNWGIDCVNQGYTVESLPYNGQITYGMTSNLQDLSNYKVFVIDEPNILFTDTEKAAIITFVQHGGGLCIISDHTISDRNNDGADSPQVLNDLLSNNTVQNNAFGIAFDYNDISQTSSNIANLPTNPILHGTAGTVSQVKWSNGTTMSLNTAQNSSVTGLVYKTGTSSTGSTNVLCAAATYQSGKVVAIGDSSITDDGTGDSGDTLYNGYITDANGNHQKLLMNAIIWLATPSALGIETSNLTNIDFTITPNPLQNKELKFSYSNIDNEPTQLAIYDTLGRSIKTIPLSNNENSLALAELNSGVYFAKISNGKQSKVLRFILQ